MKLLVDWLGWWIETHCTCGHMALVPVRMLVDQVGGHVPLSSVRVIAHVVGSERPDQATAKLPLMRSRMAFSAG